MKNAKLYNEIESTFTACNMPAIYVRAAIEHIFANGYDYYAKISQKGEDRAVLAVGRDWDKRAKETEEENAQAAARGEKTFVCMMTTRDFETCWARALFALAKNYSIKELATYLAR